MPTSVNREIEIKLRIDGARCRATDVRRLAADVGVELPRAKRVDQCDVYLDDREFRLARAGITLRIREIDGERRICVKVERRMQDGMFERDEVELPFAGALPERVAELPRALGDRLEPFVFGRRLRPVVCLRTARRLLVGAPFVVALDDVRVEDGRGARVGRFAELEIEVATRRDIDSARALADRLQARFGFTESTRSKLRQALALRGAELRNDEALDVPLHLSIREAARRVLAVHFRRLQREEARTRVADAPESVHKLRVACRRLRAAVRTFGPWLAPRQRKLFRATLRATARAFGDARDLDVLALDLTGRSEQLPPALRRAGLAIVERIRAAGAAARKHGRRVLRDRDRVEAFRRIERFVACPAPVDGGELVRDVAPRLIRREFHRVLEHGRSLDARSDPAAVHELRILMKRLRYSAEGFVDGYGVGLRRFVERVTHLQEVLGEFNDADVALRRLGEFARHTRDLSRAERLALGAWLAIEHARGLVARQRFDATWAEFDSDELGALLDAALGGVANRA